METLKQNKNMLIGLGVVIVLAGAYFMFSGDSSTSSQDAALTSQQVTGPDDSQGELLQLLLELRSISLDEQIFDNPVFERLESFSTEIQPQQTGRPNPFAPFSSN